MSAFVDYARKMITYWICWRFSSQHCRVLQRKAILIVLREVCCSVGHTACVDDAGQDLGQLVICGDVSISWHSLQI